MEKLALFTQGALSAFTLVDVIDDHAHDRHAVFLQPEGGRQLHPEGPAVVVNQAYFDGLRLGGFKEPSAMLLITVGAFLEKEARERLADQRAAPHPQNRRCQEVGLQNQSGPAERAITDRCQVIEIKIALPHDVQRDFRFTKFLVLHLQFDLVYAQLMQRPTHRFGRDCVLLLRRLSRSLTKKGFSLVVQHLHRRQVRVFL